MLRSLQTILRRNISSKSSSLVKVKPNNFNAIATNYGWFVVPKTHYGFRWTIPRIHSAIQEKYKDPASVPKDIATLQAVVDEWVEKVDLSQKPEALKMNRKEIRRLKDEAIYRSQLKDNDVTTEPQDRLQDPISVKKTRRKSNMDRVTFIHAWNYFFSLQHNRYSHLPTKESRKEISNEWNSLSVEEKEAYRESYSDLLKEGKDVYRGKIVTREEKLKRSTQKKK